MMRKSTYYFTSIMPCLDIRWVLPTRRIHSYFASIEFIDDNLPMNIGVLLDRVGWIMSLNGFLVILSHF